jgi:hypothetical protein
MIRVVHPGSRIPDPDADFLPARIPDPGVKKVPNPGSRIRIRNTALHSDVALEDESKLPLYIAEFYQFAYAQ